MYLNRKFIKATEEYNTFEKNVPAYYFRKSFNTDSECEVKISVAACGFYELYLNGKNITKGLLSPYISNTNDYIYGDEYDASLDMGENVIGIILGNGLQNNPGGHIWDFDKADFRSSPMVSVSVNKKEDGYNTVLLESDQSFKIAPSPIRSDDYRFGEFYDANYEIKGWNEKSFDDASWGNAFIASAPSGELCLADVEPIVKECEMTPVCITKSGDGFIYDFGVSHSGVCRLKINGEKGKQIEIRYADSLENGDLNLSQVWFVREFWERDKNIVHRDTYICKGEGVEEYQPRFTYHGFRYARVDGITEEQATKDLLTYVVYHTKAETMGGFECSDEVANKLQEITRRSIISNFHHFPTDCPQREKNGWTADAALSCESVLLNFNLERNYVEWMKNICKAQAKNGSLPGIVPTGGWGFHWGNGPAWDSVLAWIPYYTYIYRGKTEMVTESASAFMSYLRYVRTRADENGLVAIGLGDWVQVGGGEPKAPLILTDSVMCMDIAKKMSLLFGVVGMKEEAEFAECESKKYREAIRTHLVDFENMYVVGNCQCSQAMGIYYNVFDEKEKEAAFSNLLKLIHQADDHIDLGVLGGRIIFHVLDDFGYSDLAYKMITRDDFPSYGNWLKRGATTLWEDFLPDRVSSMNHNFWGDISSWFIKCIAGIRLNPNLYNVNQVKIKPSFIKVLENASAFHIAPAGKISVSWKRETDHILLCICLPEKMEAVAELPSGFVFEEGNTSKPVTSGVYKILKK